MFTAQQREQALNRRRARFVQYISAGVPLSEIAEREGVEEEYAKSLRKEIAAEDGLSILPTKALSSDERASRLPFGMTTASARLRGKLADLLYWRKEHPIDLAHKVGINQKAQKHNRNNPYNYDWKISELERLAALEGKDFVTFIKELL